MQELITITIKKSCIERRNIAMKLNLVFSDHKLRIDWFDPRWKIKVSPINQTIYGFFDSKPFKKTEKDLTSRHKHYRVSVENAVPLKITN